MEIDAKLVSELAELAQLDLGQEEVERMRRDLQAILTYVEKLAELDTHGVPETAHVLDLATPLRDDRVRDVLPAEQALRNAPDHDEQAMVVPKVVE